MKRINPKNFLNNRMIKAGSLSLLATIMIRAINLISVPIFSRILTTAEYGQVDVFMTYVNIFIILLGLDFHAAIGKGRLDFKEEADEYVTSSILFTSITSIVIVVLINLFFEQIKFVFGLDRWAVNTMLLYSYAMFLMTYRTGEYNFNFEYKNNMKMSVTVALLNVVLSVAFIETIFKDGHLLGRILGATIPTVICAVIIFVFYGKRGHWCFKKKYIVYSLKYGVPLIPHNLSHLILGSADKVMINSMISSSASGIYSLSYTLGLMLQVIVEGLNQVFGPWLYRKLDSNEYDIVTYVQKLYILFFSAATIGVMAISPEILKVIGGREYWEGTTMILWIVFSVFINFTYMLYVNIEFFYKTTALISTGTIFAAVINVVLNMLFLKKIGYQFGAISTVLSYVALLAFHMFIVNCVLKKKIVKNSFMLVVVVFVFGIMCVMQCFLEHILIRILIAILGCVVCLLALYYMYRKGKSTYITQLKCERELKK